MSRWLLSLLLVTLLLPQSRAGATAPAETMANSEQVLAELLAIPGRQIPARLLSEAQGIAIVPRVIKVGFVAGVRRGFGVIMARDADGAWSLPRFIRLTGGSVGWQAGIQGTDVVLVFRTRRSMESLLRGRFTVGVDASAAAGPVGRNAAAATDARLQAEILSYSRSRGLFLGASVDGSVIELDHAANTAFYGSADMENPLIIPASATRLQTVVATLTGAPIATPVAAAAAGTAVAAPAVEPAPAATAQSAAADGTAVVTAANFADVRAEALRRSLVAQTTELHALLDADWQAFLALPAATFDATAPPNLAALAEVYARFENVARSSDFTKLTTRPEFQDTMELLREYIAAEKAISSTLQLPAPPVLAPAPAATAPADARR